MQMWNKNMLQEWKMMSKGSSVIMQGIHHVWHLQTLLPNKCLLKSISLCIQRIWCRKHCDVTCQSYRIYGLHEKVTTALIWVLLVRANPCNENGERLRYHELFAHFSLRTGMWSIFVYGHHVPLTPVDLRVWPLSIQVSRPLTGLPLTFLMGQANTGCNMPTLS